ncbi:hypothetical protein HS041_20205 [Planomonospora sp. ID67723]|uniref:hypothetical protein n=1 Tax=Planomonospora sp. ID67723 TaxID=2738134 RepID=UPI0018C3BFBB|nr:hypothetical protein [Planomonospora sp. ID67723]MBG0830094.1 hypothetical protein [Planomonospora sp. ID67723]
MATGSPESRSRIKRRLRRALGITMAPAAVLVLMAAPASAAPAPVANGCLVHHELYQQPVAAIIAHAELPDESCGVGPISLKVYRNGVLVASISGGPALTYRYDCITTAPTVWRTNWDRSKTFNCG